jgi:mannose-1-phosphate guanylyltransferase
MKPVREDATEAGAIILAGGEGTRLLSLTRGIAGHDLPKQFCPLIGKETLLEQTRRRISLSIPPETTVTVMTRAHERFFSLLVAGVPGRNLAIQPVNRDTAAAILFGLFRLVSLDRVRTVAIFPSDHYISDDLAFMRHVDAAISAASFTDHKIVLLGIPADRPEASYGWIEPGEQLTKPSWNSMPIFRIRRFWEKPTPSLAGDLWSLGMLWNSFVMVAEVTTLIDLFAKVSPRLYMSFTPLRVVLNTSVEERAIDHLYANLPSVNFSEAILGQCFAELSVLPVRGLEWNDLAR